MKKKVAIIDLGTNTFNLLIVEIKGSEFQVLHIGKIAARLGKGGINQGQISEDAFERGLQAMIEHKKTADEFGCKKIIAIATSMMREAKNAKEFIRAVREATKIKIEVVSGDEEAELIWNGVRNAVKMDSPRLIMDIGGGSTEFIIADKERIIWKKSYDLGITRLYEKFPHSDPIDSSELVSFRSYLRRELEELIFLCEKHGIFQMIGSAGSFESYVNMLNWKHNDQDFDFSKNSRVSIPMNEFNQLADWFYSSTRAQRTALPGLIELRRDLIVLASAMIQLVIEECHIRQLELSTYALKEGVLFRLIASKST